MHRKVPGGFGKGRLEKDCPHETTRKDFWHVRGNNSTSPTAYFILWQHVRRMNEDAAYKVARIIATVCAKYPGCVLLFERLRKISAKGASKSKRLNRKQANHLRGRSISVRARKYSRKAAARWR